RASLSSHRPLPVRSGHTLASRIEPRLGRIATELAGRPTEARCWSPRDWDVVVHELHAFYGEAADRELAGFAEPAISRSARIHLAPYVCSELSLAHPSLTVDLSFAVDVIAHESQHIFSPNGSEADTECASMQRIPRAASLLGYSPKLGRE